MLFILSCGCVSPHDSIACHLARAKLQPRLETLRFVCVMQRRDCPHARTGGVECWLHSAHAGALWAVPTTTRNGRHAQQDGARAPGSDAGVVCRHMPLGLKDQAYAQKRRKLFLGSLDEKEERIFTYIDERPKPRLGAVAVRRADTMTRAYRLLGRGACGAGA
jgi:hypothetical protein